MTECTPHAIGQYERPEGGNQNATWGNAIEGSLDACLPATAMTSGNPEVFLLAMPRSAVLASNTDVSSQTVDESEDGHSPWDSLNLELEELTRPFIAIRCLFSISAMHAICRTPRFASKYISRPEIYETLNLLSIHRIQNMAVNRKLKPLRAATASRDKKSPTSFLVGDRVSYKSRLLISC